MKKILAFILAIIISCSSVFSLTSIAEAYPINNPPYTYFPSTPAETDPNTGENSRVTYILYNLMSFRPDIVNSSTPYIIIVYFTPRVSSSPAYYSAELYSYSGSFTTGLLPHDSNSYFSATPANYRNRYISAWGTPICFWNDSSNSWQNYTGSRTSQTLISIYSDAVAESFYTNLGSNYVEDVFFTPTGNNSLLWDVYDTFHGGTASARTLLYFFGTDFGGSPPKNVPVYFGDFGPDAIPGTTIPTTTTVTTAPQPTQQTLPAEWFEDNTVEEPDDIDTSVIPSPSSLLDSLNSLKEILTDGLSSFSEGITFWLKIFDAFLNYFPWMKTLILVIFIFSFIIFLAWRL